MKHGVDCVLMKYIMDIKTIKHLLSLARVKLGVKEEEKMKDDLSSILKYIEQLNKVETGNVGPLYQTTGLTNSLRIDDHRNDFAMTEELKDKLIGQAPNKRDGFIEVKSVLKK